MNEQPPRMRALREVYRFGINGTFFVDTMSPHKNIKSQLCSHDILVTERARKDIGESCFALLRHGWQTDCAQRHKESFFFPLISLGYPGDRTLVYISEKILVPLCYAAFTVASITSSKVQRVVIFQLFSLQNSTIS